MRPLILSNRLLSDPIWRSILDHSEVNLELKRSSFFQMLSSLEDLRKSAAHNTGSVPASTAWLLYSVAYMFKPRFVLEVGTFLGKSTVAMAMGLSDAGVGDGEVHSCDMSNDITLPTDGGTPIVQYPMQSSTDMFRKIASTSGEDRKVELMHLDGRIQDEDLSYIEKVRSNDVIYALDDFEGMKKGVINYMDLRNAGLIKGYQLVHPPSEALLARFGFHARSTTVLLIPGSSLGFVSQ